MVAVIVDDGYAVPFAGFGEAALDAAETRDRLSDGVVGKPELMRDRDRGGGIERVVAPRHRQHDVGYLIGSVGLAVAKRHLDFRTAADRIEIGQPRFGLRIFAVGDDAAILDLADHGLHHGVVDAHHGETVERHVLDELLVDRILHRLDVLK